MLNKTLSGILILVVQVYRMTLGLLLPNSCRFQPTCSAYAVDALRTYGPWRGIYLSIKRILRCHPFHSGGYDPVPSLNSTEGKNLFNGCQ